MKLPEICIGTVQFGKDYGITNRNGKIPQKEAKQILLKMQENNLSFIDTAQSYGISEKVIGKILEENKNFKIISKVNPKFSFNLNNNEQKKLWDNLLDKSLMNLKQKNLEGILLHSPYNLNKDQKLLLTEWLCEIKAKRKVNKIGLSIYDELDIKDFDINQLDIIQLPLSIYDTRLLNNGMLAFFKSKGIDIFARSIFLQGLILNKPSQWPEWISHEDKMMHKNFLNFLKRQNISALQVALAFVHNIPLIKSIVIGVSSIKEFEEILNTFNKIDCINLSKIKKNLPTFSKEILDPRLWRI